MLLLTMLLTAFCCAFLVIRPFFQTLGNTLDYKTHSEKEDLNSFLASLDFELQRKLITDHEYVRQKERVSKRLAEISAD